MKIPKSIANDCPAKCPKCKKGQVDAVFRDWKTKTKRVSCTIVHSSGKTCRITYDF